MKNALLLTLALMTVQPTFAKEANGTSIMCVSASAASDLKRDIQKLNEENRDLRNQLDTERSGQSSQSSQPVLEYFSFVACADDNGNADLRFLASGDGEFKIEAEENARKEHAFRIKCRGQLVVVGSAPVYTKKEGNYCRAACTDANGVPDNRYSSAAKGRNIVEAKFNALKKAQWAWQCGQGVKIQACE